MQHIQIPVTPYQQNCSLAWCKNTGLAVCIDPGGEVERIQQAISDQGLVLEKVLLTHGHLDHAGGALALSRLYSVPILGPHPDDAFLLASLPQQAQMFGFPPAQAFEPQQWLQESDSIQVGQHRLHVVHCPGHTPGHVVLINTETRIAFVGDVLFQNSIGRTDFPRGNHADLIHSIRHKLFPLGDDMAFVPGHGPMSTFGRERQHNPYVSDSVCA